MPNSLLTLDCLDLLNDNINWDFNEQPTSYNKLLIAFDYKNDSKRLAPSMTKNSFLFQLKILNLFSNCQTYQSYHLTHTGRAAVSKILFVFFSFIYLSMFCLILFSFIYLFPFLHTKSLVMPKIMTDKSVFVCFDDQRYYYGQMFVFKCSTILHQENTTDT
jgi:hypothetical protein